MYISYLYYFLQPYPRSSTVRKKATYDKFGEEGLKGGIPTEFSSQTGAWSSAYVYHGNPEKTFRQFFGSDNPFAGKKVIQSRNDCV